MITALCHVCPSPDKRFRKQLFFRHFSCNDHFLPAGGTKFFHKPLRNDKGQRRGEQVRRNAHICQADRRRYGIVRMKRRQDKMPGKSGMYGNFRRLPVAYFPNHHHIGILPHKRTKSFFKSKARFFIHFHLGDSRYAVLHGIFHGNHADSGTAHQFQRRVERRCFPASRRTGSENHAAFLSYFCAEYFLLQGKHPEFILFNEIHLPR